MARSAPAKAAPWRSASIVEGSGSCVSLRFAPEMNVEANVSTKRKTLSTGGRSRPSVPGPGGGGGRRSPAFDSALTREPLPRLAQQIQREARRPAQLARLVAVL